MWTPGLFNVTFFLHRFGACFVVCAGRCCRKAGRMHRSRLLQRLFSAAERRKTASPERLLSHNTPHLAVCQSYAFRITKSETRHHSSIKKNDLCANRSRFSDSGANEFNSAAERPAAFGYTDHTHHEHRIRCSRCCKAVSCVTVIR